MNRIVSLLVLLLLITGISAGSQRYIDTTFVTYDMHELFSDLDGWFDELERLKIQAVIIDAMMGIDEICRIRWKKGMPENLKTFMDKAQERGIRVYIGLVWAKDSDFYVYHKSLCIRYWTDILLSWIKWVDSHPAHAGWYIPNEPAIPCWDLETVMDHYKHLRTIIQQYSKKPVLVSPHFCPETKYLFPYKNGLKAKRFLDTTGIDILIWQDGMGCFSILNPEIVAENFREIEKQVGRNRLWVLIELHNNMCDYTCPNPDYSSAFVERIKKQIALEGLYGDRIACWNQTHHMSSYTRQSIINGGEKLKTDYINEILLRGGSYDTDVYYQEIH